MICFKISHAKEMQKNCSDISVLQRVLLPAIPAIAINSGTRQEGNNTFKSPEVMAAV